MPLRFNDMKKFNHKKLWKVLWILQGNYRLCNK